MSLRTHISDLAAKGYTRQEIYDSILPQISNYNIKEPKKLANKILYFPTRTVWKKSKRAYQFLIALIALSAILQLVAGIQFSQENNVNIAFSLVFPLFNFIFLFFLITKRLNVLRPIAILTLIGYVRGFKDMSFASDLDMYVFGVVSLIIISIVSVAFYLSARMHAPFEEKKVKNEEGKIETKIVFPDEEKSTDEEILI
ncbi:MAG: hypothetical protein K1X56_12765 [Flavobacteriales bacterium]|nr:hypothetical protein [Flavobacteriales bacterium]